jgi:glycogen operon protein
LAFHARLRLEGLDDLIYAAFNSYWETLDFDLPLVDDSRQWQVFANTGMESPNDVFLPGTERPLEVADSISIGGRSAVILVAR